MQRKEEKKKRKEEKKRRWLSVDCQEGWGGQTSNSIITLIDEYLY